MFKHKLYIIDKELGKHHRTRNEIMESSVTERLDKALLSYMDSLTKSYDYLRYRDNIRVLKKINRG